MGSPSPADLPRLLEEIGRAVRARSALKPRLGIILGSGLGPLAEAISDAARIPYAELPHFPISSVIGHPGKLVMGNLGAVPVVAMQGRVHAYEGYAPWQVALPARVLCALGIRTLIVTNAAGGISANLEPGDLMRITDHLNLSGMNPLAGPNCDELGPRFPDMSTAYDPGLGEALDACAAELGIPLRRGIYAQLSGPSYETPAEIRMLKTLGADAVGMSTVPEVIAAVHMGVKVVGVSCITNQAAGLSLRPLSHSEVSETADRVQGRFSTLLTAFVERVERLPSSAG